MPEYTPEQFAALLVKAAAVAPREAVQVVRKGSANVKRDARASVLRTAPVHHAHAAATINFDVEAVGVVIEGDIGYDKEANKRAGKKTGPGGIGNLLEFGGGGDHSPPHRDLSRALEAEEPRFIKAVEDLGERLLDGR